MAKRRSRPHPVPLTKGPAPAGKAEPEAKPGEPHPHRDPIPLWLIIAVFLFLEVVVILANYGKWQYRTVIAKAKQAMAEHRWDDALNYWAEHAKNYPGAVGTISFRTDRARSRLGAADYKGALEDLNFVLAQMKQKKQAPDAALLGDVGKCQAELGQTQQALETYQKVLQLDPSNVEANLYIGRRLLDQGKILEAAKRFQSVPVESYPEDLKKRWQVIEDRYIQKAEQQAGFSQTTTPTLSTGSQPAAPSGPTSTPEATPTPARPEKSGS